MGTDTGRSSIGSVSVLKVKEQGHRREPLDLVVGSPCTVETCGQRKGHALGAGAAATWFYTVSFVCLFVALS